MRDWQIKVKRFKKYAHVVTCWELDGEFDQTLCEDGDRSLLS